jgi:hypothetical protein
MKTFQVIALFFFMTANNFLVGQEISIFQSLFGHEYYVDNHKISRKDFNKLIEKNKAANEIWQRSKRNSWAAAGFSGAQVGLSLYAITLATSGKQRSALTPLYASIGCGLVGLIFSHKYLKYRKNAILEYNNSFDKKSNSYITPSSNGIGLALNF